MAEEVKQNIENLPLVIPADAQPVAIPAKIISVAKQIEAVLNKRREIEAAINEANEQASNLSAQLTHIDGQLGLLGLIQQDLASGTPSVNFVN